MQTHQGKRAPQRSNSTIIRKQRKQISRWIKQNKSGTLSSFKDWLIGGLISFRSVLYAPIWKLMKIAKCTKWLHSFHGTLTLFTNMCSCLVWILLQQIRVKNEWWFGWFSALSTTFLRYYPAKILMSSHLISETLMLYALFMPFPLSFHVSWFTSSDSLTACRTLW